MAEVNATAGMASAAREKSVPRQPQRLAGLSGKRWHDAKREAELKLGRKIPGTFHDIKAKAVSDFEGSSKDKQLFRGHKTELQVATYDRKVKISPTLNVPPLQKDE